MIWWNCTLYFCFQARKLEKSIEDIVAIADKLHASRKTIQHVEDHEASGVKSAKELEFRIQKQIRQDSFSLSLSSQEDIEDEQYFKHLLPPPPCFFFIQCKDWTKLQNKQNHNKIKTLN